MKRNCLTHSKTGILWVSLKVSSHLKQNYMTLTCWPQVCCIHFFHSEKNNSSVAQRDRPRAAWWRPLRHKHIEFPRIPSSVGVMFTSFTYPCVRGCKCTDIFLRHLLLKHGIRCRFTRCFFVLEKGKTLCQPCIITWVAITLCSHHKLWISWMNVNFTAATSK